MKLKHVKSELSKLNDFNKPSILLEQYTTPIDIASEMLTLIDADCRLDGKIVFDFGCGSGILGIGASLFSPNFVLFCDIDPISLELSKKNITTVHDSYDSADFMLIDLSWPMSVNRIGMADVVIMNPPFGTKHNQGIDVCFIKNALFCSPLVYSLHKSSTRKYILRTARELFIKCTVLHQIRYNLNNTYRFHRKEHVDIDVDLIKFEKYS